MKKILIITLLCTGINTFAQAELMFFKNLKAIFIDAGKNIDQLCNLMGTTQDEIKKNARQFLTKNKNIQQIKETICYDKIDKEFIRKQFIQTQLPPSLVTAGLGILAIYAGVKITNKIAKLALKIAGISVIGLAILHLAAHGSATNVLIH